MRVVPNLEAKLLGEMVPGELIRFSFRRTMLLGIIAGCECFQLPSGLVIILLDEIPERPGTALGFVPMIESMMSQIALSYGLQSCLVVHPTAPVASDRDERFNTTGALLIGGGVKAIRSRMVRDEFNELTLLINAESWTAIPQGIAQPQRLAVLAWELRLLHDLDLNPAVPPVFTFGLKS